MIIGESQFPVMQQCISILIQVHMCVYNAYACLPLLFSFIELLLLHSNQKFFFLFFFSNLYFDKSRSIQNS